MTAIAPITARSITPEATPGAGAADAPTAGEIAEFREWIDSAQFHTNVALGSLETNNRQLPFTAPVSYNHSAWWADEAADRISRALKEPVHGPARDSAEGALKAVRTGRNLIEYPFPVKPFGVPTGYYTGRQAERHLRTGIELLQQADAQAAAYQAQP